MNVTIAEHHRRQRIGAQRHVDVERRSRGPFPRCRRTCGGGLPGRTASLALTQRQSFVVRVGNVRPGPEIASFPTRRWRLRPNRRLRPVATLASTSSTQRANEPPDGDDDGQWLVSLEHAGAAEHGRDERRRQRQAPERQRRESEHSIGGQSIICPCVSHTGCDESFVRGIFGGSRPAGVSVGQRSVFSIVLRALRGRHTPVDLLRADLCCQKAISSLPLR